MSESIDNGVISTRISIVIVSYNSAEVLEACLSAIDPHNNVDLEVIVVDNASTDNTVALIRSEYPSVKVIQSASNDGFAVAVNRGAKVATGSYIALINPDAVLTASALRDLVQHQQRSERPCITAPLIVHPGDRLRIVSAGRFPSSWRMFTHYSGLSRVAPNRLLQGHYLLPRSLKPVESVDWVTGAALVVSKEVWERLQGLSERWFMYAEDVDLCWRAKKLGISVVLLRDVQATHLVGESAGHRKAMKADWVVNLYDFYRTSMGAGRVSSLCWKVVVASGLLSRAAVYKAAAVRSKRESTRDDWGYESRRFLYFAQEVLRS